MSITRTSFEEIIDRIHTVPSLPEVVTQVVRLVNDPKSDASQINDIMSKDPGMAAKILRMVNSVYYGLQEPVHNLEQAIMILGFKTIRSIALSISVINAFQQKDAQFNMRHFWMHSSVCACIGRLLAGKAHVEDPELGFVIGLIKDIGVLILVEHAPEETRGIIALAREYRLDLRQATRKVIDTDHVEIGAWLCERWGLDPVIIDTVRNQHDIEAGSDRRLVAICMFSEYLCGLKRLRIPGQCNEPKLDPLIWHHLGFDKTALVDVLSVINDEVDNAKQLLNMAQT
ncbi:MAG: HDOD domain-containing protein [Planctomycetota bacterium]